MNKKELLIEITWKNNTHLFVDLSKHQIHYLIHTYVPIFKIIFIKFRKKGEVPTMFKIN